MLGGAGGCARRSRAYCTCYSSAYLLRSVSLIVAIRARCQRAKCRCPRFCNNT